MPVTDWVPRRGLSAGTSVSIQALRTIYFTLDGSDPRSLGGSIRTVKFIENRSHSVQAQSYEHARSATAEWSAIVNAHHTVAPNQVAGNANRDGIFHSTEKTRSGHGSFHAVSHALTGHGRHGPVLPCAGKSSKRSYLNRWFSITIRSSGVNISMSPSISTSVARRFLFPDCKIHEPREQLFWLERLHYNGGRLDLRRCIGNRNMGTALQLGNRTVEFAPSPPGASHRATEKRTRPATAAPR